jgi:RHS repeat-associated protein
MKMYRLLIPVVVIVSLIRPTVPSAASESTVAQAYGPTTSATSGSTLCPNVTASPTRLFLPLVSRSGGGLASASVSQPQNPPDPGTVARPLDRTVATDIASGSAFLDTGNHPSQVGMAAGVIDPLRVAVLRGLVCDRSGQPIAGVQITVLNHPEYGSTLTGADGLFDMTVNGGGLVTVVYAKTGYLPAQRQTSPPLLDTAWLPDVLLMARDTRVTTVDLTGSAPMQAAQGSLVSDQDGARRGTLLIPQGVQAEIYTPGGTTQAVTSLNLRLTEYTVGAGGPLAMPAQLPPASGYTYAIELGADEAQTKVNGQDVLFNQPVYFYVENFLGFPTGMSVPTGYYDAQKAAWIPSPNGRVIKIINVTNGMANLDTNGDGVADNDPALGITDAERGKLAALYAPGRSLWRVPLTHLSTVDCNWPYGPPSDADAPNGSPPPDDGPPQCGGQSQGSIIECQHQALGEAVDIAGTPFSLHYQSDRVPGRKAAFSLDIALSGASIPASLKRIDLEVLVAGRKFTASFPAAPNQSTLFTWDGLDATGQPAQGRQYATARVGYVYGAIYQEPGAFGQAFGRFSGVPITGSRARQEITLWQEWKRLLGIADMRASRLGGWSLSAQHAYDPKGRTLFLGDGGRLDADARGVTVINTAAGGGSVPGPGIGDGGPATQAELAVPYGVAVGPDGSLYIAEDVGQRVRRVSPSGIITTVAGSTSGLICYTPTDACGDGGPATQALLSNPDGVAVGADGSVYIADRSDHRIRRVSPSGIITTVAGTGAYGLSGDGGPAIAAQLNSPFGVAVAPDGALYIADTNNRRIRRVGPDGIIDTVAGTVFGSTGDGGPAIQASLRQPWRVALGPDGSLYIADHSDQRVRRVGPDGIIQTVAGTGTFGYNGDGGPATAAQLASPDDVAVAPDGSLYIADSANYRVRWVGSDGMIATVAGSGTSGFSGDGGPATRARLDDPRGLAFAPDGSLYVADWFNQRVRRVASALPGVSNSDILVPSQDGSEVYLFNGAGRHLQTRHALTGATLYTFGYDGAGRLTTVTDGDTNVTTITRDVNGDPTSIVGPYGQTTTLTLDANGYLASIANPAGETIQLGYTAGGLLTSYRDPRNNPHTFEYDAAGRLVKDSDPASGYKQLARQEGSNAYTVTLTTALGRVQQYRVETSGNGDERHIDTDPAGLQSESVHRANATLFWRTPDGTTNGVRLDPDPRWGMLAPVSALITTTTPGGLAFNLQTVRTATLSNPADPFSLTTQKETLSINGRPYASTYTAATRTRVTQSPAVRSVSRIIDAQGRLVSEQVAGLAPANYEYDGHGRLSTATRGSGPDARTASFAYDGSGYLAGFTDPLGRATSFDYDLAGRMAHQTLPDGQVITYTHDLNGNLASLAPPGRPAHAFEYTPVDLMSRYAPPDVNPGSDDTLYAYNPDRQLTLTTRPDGQTIAAGYDSAGRLSALTIARGILDLSYDASTGNLASITAPGGVGLAYSYDGALFKGATWSGATAGATAVTYDNDLRRASSDVNNSGAVAYQYDADGLLVAAGALSLSRNAGNGLLTGSTLGGVADTWGYNGFAEATSYSAAYNATPLYAVQYVRDKLGRITQKTETIGGVTGVTVYGYDLAGRLSNVTVNGVQAAAYSYDGNGNRLSTTGPGGTVNATYDAQDRLLQYGAAAYTYTANGERLAKTNGAGTTSYQTDELGNLITVTLPGGTQIAYLLDGQNRRVGKRVNGVLARGFLYEDPLRPAAELDGAGNIVSRFVYATRDNAPDYMVKGGATYRLIPDHLGSPRLVVNVATGQIVQRMDYDEFGRVLNDTNPGFQPFGYAGGLYDPDTGLVRFGARDYDAETGRWTAKDPIGFAGGDANVYAYVGSDPANRRDPGGLGDSKCPDDNCSGKFSECFGNWVSGNGWTTDAHAKHAPKDPPKKGPPPCEGCKPLDRNPPPRDPGVIW